MELHWRQHDILGVENCARDELTLAILNLIIRFNFLKFSSENNKKL